MAGHVENTGENTEGIHSVSLVNKRSVVWRIILKCNFFLLGATV
jgi:hypothetical protein